jgi:hypothetical protein
LGIIKEYILVNPNNIEIVMRCEDGIVKLSDGSTLKLKISIVDTREAGFSPFGGVNIAVKVVGGVATLEVPEEIRKKVSEKPLAPPEPPHNGWKILDIINYIPAYEEKPIKTSKGSFLVIVKAEPVMASGNFDYRTELGEPLYWLNWVYKISWKPIEG